VNQRLPEVGDKRDLTEVTVGNKTVERKEKTTESWSP
jgi:hypothetical protein